MGDTQLQLLEKYVSLILEWNEKINLISRKDTNKIWIKHILGSIGFLFHFRFHENSSLIDVGTGGGLPGIPISILQPDLSVTLLDSINKKVNAVKGIVENLKLTNVKVLCGRSEELARTTTHQGKYDYIISRAVAPTITILNWCTPLVKKVFPANEEFVSALDQKKIINKGSILLLKGGDLNEETNEVRSNAKVKKINSYPLEIKGIKQMELFEKKIIIIQP